MPRRFRFRIPRPYLWSGVLVVAVLGMGQAVWYFLHGLQERGVLFFALCFVVALYAWDNQRLWSALEEDEVGPYSLPVHAERLKRLMKTLEFWPETPPPGWSPPSSPRQTSIWHTLIGDDVVAISYVVPWKPGYRLHVTLAHRPDGPKAGTPVPDERATEIFAHLRNVGPCVEIELTPEGIAKRFAGARSWIALSYDAEGALRERVPPHAPRMVERPLNPHLAAVRRHLPARLPRGWSVPLAITEVRDGWDQGAWMIDVDEEVALVMLVSSEGRAKLAVTIFHPDKSVVDEAQAMRVLKQFRGVYEFVQTDVEGEGIEGARSYLGEIERPTKPAMLN